MLYVNDRCADGSGRALQSRNTIKHFLERTVHHGLLVACEVLQDRPLHVNAENCSIHLGSYLEYDPHPPLEKSTGAASPTRNWTAHAKEVRDFLLLSSSLS
jgi:hypothetical protein